MFLLRGFLTWFSQRLLAACFARAVRAAPFGTLAHRRAAIATACGFFSASIVLHYPINRQSLSMRAQALDGRMVALVLFMRLHCSSLLTCMRLHCRFTASQSSVAIGEEMKMANRIRYHSPCQYCGKRTYNWRTLTCRTCAQRRLANLPIIREKKLKDKPDKPNAKLTGLISSTTFDFTSYPRMGFFWHCLF